LVLGAPYRRGKATAYRDIHHRLRAAFENQAPVTITILENCLVSELNLREQHWIGIRRQEAIAGGPIVLNASRETTRSRR
jgi:hypothetical protein